MKSFYVVPITAALLMASVPLLSGCGRDEGFRDSSPAVSSINGASSSARGNAQQGQAYQQSNSNSQAKSEQESNGFFAKLRNGSLKDAINPDYYSKEDAQRAGLYDLFIRGKLSVDQTMQRIFEDPNFNRVSTIFADKYTNDLQNGRLNQQMQEKFQNLADKVGSSVYLINRQDKIHTKAQLLAAISTGAAVGAIIGVMSLKDSVLLNFNWGWLKKATPVGAGDVAAADVAEAAPGAAGATRVVAVPVVFKRVVAGNLIGAGAGYLTYKGYRFWDGLIHPTIRSFGANKLLDAAQ